MGKKNKELVISLRLFHLHTSYLVPRYNPIRRIQWPKCQWPWQCSGLRDKISGKRTNLFLTVSVLGQKMSVPKRHSVEKIVEMVSRGTDSWQIISVLLKIYQSGTENWNQSWSLIYKFVQWPVSTTRSMLVLVDFLSCVCARSRPQ